MNTKEASQQFNISERMIRKLCKEGKIKGAKKTSKGVYDIPKDTVMIITDDMARAFLFQLLKYKNNSGLVLASYGCDDEKKLDIWRHYLINQGLVSNCKRQADLKGLLDAVQLTDKGLEFVFGKNNYNVLIQLKPGINIGLVNI